MSHELEILELDPATRASLPLGLCTIFVSREILDAAALRALTLVQAKYVHQTVLLRGPLKPLSKVDP